MFQITNLRFCKGQRFVVLDAPLLYESKFLEFLCFPTIVIAVLDEDKLRKRLMDRDKSGREDAQKRINAQWSLQRKVDLADIVVDNSGTVRDLENKTLNEVIPAIFHMLDYDDKGCIKEDVE